MSEQMQQDIATIDRMLTLFPDLSLKHAAWQRLKASLSPDREVVARALAIANGWDGWDTAQTCMDTPMGNEPHEERAHFFDLADAAIQAMQGVSRERVIVVCECRRCRPITLDDMRFVVCSKCGNKRCPKATDCRNECTGSNDAGQLGSAYANPPEVSP